MSHCRQRGDTEREARDLVQRLGCEVPVRYVTFRGTACTHVTLCHLRAPDMVIPLSMHVPRDDAHRVANDLNRSAEAPMGAFVVIEPDNDGGHDANASHSNYDIAYRIAVPATIGESKKTAKGRAIDVATSSAAMALFKAQCEGVWTVEETSLCNDKDDESPNVGVVSSEPPTTWQRRRAAAPKRKFVDLTLDLATESDDGEERSDIGDEERSDIGDEERSDVGDEERSDVGDEERSEVGDEERSDIGDLDGESDGSDHIVDRYSDDDSDHTDHDQTRHLKSLHPTPFIRGGLPAKKRTRRPSDESYVS